MRTFDPNNSAEGFVPTRDQVDDFLISQKLASLATLTNDGSPTVARVAFSVTEGHELIIGTSADSRKSRNMNRDPRVAVEVTDPERRYTVQIEGFARLLAQAAFEAEYAERHYAQRPESLPFRDEPGQAHFLITPDYLRFSDCSVKPWLLTELDS